MNCNELVTPTCSQARSSPNREKDETLFTGGGGSEAGVPVELLPAGVFNLLLPSYEATEPDTEMLQLHISHTAHSQSD